MTPYANLHCHTTHSDGKWTPEQLVRTAKAEGYGAVAVTDHDAVTANPEVKYWCDQLGMETIFGVEFSVPKYHITAFDFDPEYPAMREYLRQMGERETEQTEIIFGWAVEKGEITGITWDEVLEYNKGIAWLCNDHVFRAMMNKGLAQPWDYEPFFEKNFLHQRGMVPPKYPFLTPDRLIALIHEAGGLAVLAHPHRQLGDVNALIALGLDGIEVYHPDLTPEEQQEALRIAYEKKLFISGGCDHSGLCGGMYGSFEKPEETGYYLDPQSFGTMEQHFRELKARSLANRQPAPEYSARRPNQFPCH